MGAGTKHSLSALSSSRRAWLRRIAQSASIFSSFVALVPNDNRSAADAARYEITHRVALRPKLSTMIGEILISFARFSQRELRCFEIRFDFSCRSLARRAGIFRALGTSIGNGKMRGTHRHRTSPDAQRAEGEIEIMSMRLRARTEINKKHRYGISVCSQSP